MKSLIALFFLFLHLTSRSQTIVPAIGLFQHKWITNDSYKLELFFIHDDSTRKIADIRIDVSVTKADVSVATEIVNDRGILRDTTIGDRTTLQPIYRSSYRDDMEMNLHFGKVVRGFYHNKITDKQYTVSDTTEGSYFDANMYPILLGWLPLEQDYTKKIAIYNYDPERESGVTEATILSVNSGTYKTKKSGIREVWILKVTDPVFSGLNTYYFDKTDRRLWQQETEIATMRMKIVRVE